MSVCVSVYKHVSMSVCVGVYVCMCVCVCLCVNGYVCVCQGRGGDSALLLYRLVGSMSSSTGLCVFCPFTPCTSSKYMWEARGEESALGAWRGPQPGA